MTKAKAGIRRIALWDINNTKADLVDAALRTEGSFIIEELETVKDDRERVYPSRVKFTANYQDLGTGRPLLYFLNQHSLKAGVSAEIVTRRKSATPTYDGVFKFLDPDYMGMEWDYIMTGERCYADVTLSCELEWDRAKLLIDSSQGNTIETWSGSSEAAYPISYYRKPAFVSAKVGSTDLFSSSDIIYRKISIKSVGTPNINGQNNIHSLMIAVEYQLMKAQKQDLKTFYEVAHSSQFTFRDAINSAGNYQQLDFPAGVLTPVRNFNLTKDDRKITLKLTGMIDPVNLAYTTSSGNELYTFNN